MQVVVGLQCHRYVHIDCLEQVLPLKLEIKQVDCFSHVVETAGEFHQAGWYVRLGDASVICGELLVPRHTRVQWRFREDRDHQGYISAEVSFDITSGDSAA